MRTRKLAVFVALGVLCMAVGVFMSSFQFFILGCVLLLFGWIPWRKLELPTDVERAGAESLLREGDVHEIKMRIRGTAPPGSLVTVKDQVPEGVLVSRGNDLIMAVKGDRSEHAPLWKRGYDLFFPHMGRFKVGPLDLKVWDPFGFFVEEAKVEATDDFMVYPGFQNMSHLPGVFTRYRHFLSNYKVRKSGIGYEFFHIRDWRPGDPFKSINWKAYARTRKLLVNVKEKEVSYSAILIIDARSANTVGTRKHNPLSWSVSSALSLSSYLLRTKNEVGLLTYGDNLYFIPPSSAGVQLNRMQELLIDLQPGGSIPFGVALDVAMREMSPSTVLFLFSSLIGDPSLMDALHWAKLKNIDLTIITPPAEFFNKALLDPGIRDASGEDAKQPRGLRGAIARRRRERERKEAEASPEAREFGELNYEVLMVMRRNFLRDLKTMGVRVVDWSPGVPIERLLEALE